ncbi:hypothetical protein TA5113_00104 [Cognatishimia activa]|nr:hypothetical protein TA5113_00104 [Cognatishimia activa]
MQILKNFAVVAALSVPVMGEAGRSPCKGEVLWSRRRIWR